MLENEDSVVTSLNELRKLKHERITRQTQSRAIMGAGRAAALAVDPASDQMTPPPALVPQVAPARQSSQFAQVPSASSSPAFPAAGSGGFAHVPAPFSVAPMPAPAVIQVRTSYKAAVIVTVLLLGAGGAGYMKLQGDMQQQLKAKESAIKKMDEERLLAAGVAAKSEAQTRSTLRQCEDKLKALAAAPPAAAAPALAVTPSAPAAVEKKIEKPAKAARVAKSKPAARPARRAKADAAEPAAPKSGDVPTIAKKKKLDNDPLAGLGKL